MDYTEYLKNELQPAFGCTEPIALAYAASRARDILGENPDKITAYLSGNIIKNAHSVYVPGTEGRKGIPISIVAGCFMGDSSKKLEVLAGIDKSKLFFCDDQIANGILTVHLAKGVENLYIDISMKSKDKSSRVVIEDSHTNIVIEEKNGVMITQAKTRKDETEELDIAFENIYEYARTCDYRELKELLDMQMEYNLSIAKEGMDKNWGSNIGSTVLLHGNGSETELYTAYAAAGSDARMSGCELPVVINSGSGNQGITVTVPLVLYGQEHDVKGELLYRGLIFANLVGLYLKGRIGKLSAYCGVVSAAAASICGIAFMAGDSLAMIEETLTNALAVNSGVICDGAKASCAGKIASSLRNAFLARAQAHTENTYLAGDGIVKTSIDETINTVGIIARDGMGVTDEVILQEMIKK